MITIPYEKLMKQPSKRTDAGGPVHRAKSRIALIEELERRKMKHRERRNIYIGEIAEEAAAMAMLADGYTVMPRSWEEFKYERGKESEVDLFAWMGDTRISVQVKGSENGNRSIKKYLLDRYIASGVDIILFVAVRQFGDLIGDETCHFKCEVSTAISPKKLAETWDLNEYDVYTPHDNKTYISKWRFDTFNS